MPELTSQILGGTADARQAPARGAGIASVAMCVPDRIVPNAEITERLAIDANWIAKRTGGRERRIAWPEVPLRAFSTQAGGIALERAGMPASELDLVLVATMSADELTPNAAPLVA